jgi:hypothetical protein
VPVSTRSFHTLRALPPCAQQQRMLDSTDCVQPSCGCRASSLAVDTTLLTRMLADRRAARRASSSRSRATDSGVLRCAMARVRTRVW